MKNVPESVPEFCSICPRKMSFVPEKFPENPRIAPEKYGMYGLNFNEHLLVQSLHGLENQFYCSEYFYFKFVNIRHASLTATFL